MTLTIPDFSALNVLVVGDAMLDEYWFGATERISPEAPVPVVRTQRSEQRAGGAANVALNLAALGCHVELAALVGRDDRGDALEALLSEHGVVCRFVRMDDCPTVHKLRVLSRNQQLIRLDYEEPIGHHGERFAQQTADWMAAADIVVLSDYGKGSLAAVESLIGVARQHGQRALVDPKGRDFRRYRGATIITPNEREFADVAGAWTSESDFEERAERLRDELELDALLVTRGQRGMTLLGRGAPAISLPAEAREVFDVTGAGDTVIALMAAGLGSGLDFDSAASLANLGAGLVVRKIGVASVSPAELGLALHRRGAGGRGLVGAEELQVLLREARNRGERVIMTNGCFDILHAGHVAYLEEAKALGDRLIVAINDDDSVTRLKGSGRPITPLADRMAVLAGLAAVDWVVPFSEDTPESLIAGLLPDVLVKGGDYRAEDVAGGRAVIANGGEVRILSFRQGRSTSGLIDAIRRG